MALCQVAPSEYDWNNCKDLMKISEYVFVLSIFESEYCIDSLFFFCDNNNFSG